MEYFFDSDHDGHWYMIPELRRAAWGTWLDSHDTEPEWAMRLGGPINTVVFQSPRETFK